MNEISVIVAHLSQLQGDESLKYIGRVANLYSSGKLTEAVVPEECEAFNGKLAGKIKIFNVLHSIWDEINFSEKGVEIGRKEVVSEYNKLCGAILV